MDRILTLEFARVTEAAAIEASQVIGHGKKDHADDLAVKAMRAVFDEIAISGTVVIGEGDLDEAPMLYIGEKVGAGSGPEVDIAVDPLEGTNLVAKGQNGAIAVLAIANKGGMMAVPDMYMDKIAVGPKAKGKISLEKTPTENVKAVAKALGKTLSEMAIVVIDRPRNQELIDEIRSCGAMIKLVGDGDVMPAVATGFASSGIDMVMGCGGAPEGIIAAAALKCLGGDMCGRLRPEVTNQEMCRDMKLDVDCGHLTLEKMVPSEDIIFSMTAITDNSLQKGVYYSEDNRIHTNTLVMRNKTGTVRFIDAFRIYTSKDKWSKYVN
jgi:fructose-1,6-bisphosphatase II